MHLDTLDPFVNGDPMPFLPRRENEKQVPNIRRRIIQSDPAYAAMIEALDTNIGRLLQTLQDEGLADDTLVVFTSDNGGLATAEGSPTCNAPWSEGKGWNAEGGTRACQIMRYPRMITPGATCQAPVTSTDFYPTFLALAGLPPRPETTCGWRLARAIVGQCRRGPPA